MATTTTVIANAIQNIHAFDPYTTLGEIRDAVDASEPLNGWMPGQRDRVALAVQQRAANATVYLGARCPRADKPNCKCATRPSHQHIGTPYGDACVISATPYTSDDLRDYVQVSTCAGGMTLLADDYRSALRSY